MKVLKPLNKSTPIILREFTKHFGVETSIFFPTSLDSTYGGKGSNITYTIDPVYSEKMLIPSVIKTKPSGFQGIIDPFLDGDSHILYLSGATIIPDYSKVAINMYDGGAVSVFKVDHCETVSDDQYVYLRKYILTSVIDLSQMEMQEVEFNDLVDHEINIEEEVELPIIRETITKEVKKVQWGYSPINEA